MSAKTTYNFNPETGEYIGSEPAIKNPLEAGKYLLPANATFIEPPKANTGEIPVWTGASWSMKPDKRGQEYWHQALTLIANHHAQALNDLTGNATPEERIKSEAALAWSSGTASDIQTTLPLIKAGARLLTQPDQGDGTSHNHNRSPWAHRTTVMKGVGQHGGINMSKSHYGVY